MSDPFEEFERFCQETPSRKKLIGREVKEDLKQYADDYDVFYQVAMGRYLIPDRLISRMYEVIVNKKNIYTYNATAASVFTSVGVSYHIEYVRL